MHLEPQNCLVKNNLCFKVISLVFFILHWHISDNIMTIKQFNFGKIFATSYVFRNSEPHKIKIIFQLDDETYSTTVIYIDQPNHHFNMFIGLNSILKWSLQKMFMLFKCDYLLWIYIYNSWLFSILPSSFRVLCIIYQKLIIVKT